jgi:CRISPR-associated protein Csy1
VTTGATEIDHFMSVAEMEPPDYASHYRERVHLLPGLGTRYAAPRLGPAANGFGREAFGLPQDRVLLLVPQSAFKIHPDNDALFAQVLAACPTADIVMFEDAAPANTLALDARLSASMTKVGIDWRARCHLLPRGDHQRYLAVNCLCDVMLDTLYWSGGNTSLDALAMGLPVVTLPGRFMRGRQSMAMLKLMGVTETTATSEAGFIEIAMALANSQALREGLRTRILANAGQLFDDRTPVVALAEWLIDV